MCSRKPSKLTIFLQRHVLLYWLQLCVLNLAAAWDVYKIPVQSSHMFDGAVVVRDAKVSQEDNLRGQPGQGYYISISIGTPPQNLNVLVDTGSSNFAVAAADDPLISMYFHRDQSSTYTDLETEVNVPYTQGHWKGTLGTDLVTLATLPNVTIRSNIAFINNAEQFYINGSNWQGILGLAYAEIARPDATVEPFFDSLVKMGHVQNMFSLQLCGTIETTSTTDKSMGGTLIIGGIDDTLYRGDILYTPIYREWYYEVVLTDIAVNGVSLAIDCKEYNFDKTIVDSGTTNLRLPKRVFTHLVASLKEKTTIENQEPPDEFWEGLAVLCWNKHMTPWKRFPVVSLWLAATSNSSFELVLSPQQYLRAVPDPDMEEDFRECYKFAVSRSSKGSVLGAVVMEGFYVVFDRMNKQVGFARSTCKKRDSQAQSSEVNGPINNGNDFFNCAYIKPHENQSPLMIAAYVMAGICGLCLLPLAAMFIHWQVKKCMGQRRHANDNSSLLPEEVGR